MQLKITHVQFLFLSCLLLALEECPSGNLVPSLAPTSCGKASIFSKMTPNLIQCKTPVQKAYHYESKVFGQ
jgi:hypothetical protein